jgi:hypothetical protein
MYVSSSIDIGRLLSGGSKVISRGVDISSAHIDGLIKDGFADLSS